MLFVYLSVSFVAPENPEGQNNTTMGGLQFDIFYSILYFKALSHNNKKSSKNRSKQ